MVHKLAVQLLIIASVACCLATKDWHFLGPNIAEGKETKQSPEYYCDGKICYTSDLAVDGDSSTNFAHASCSHTRPFNFSSLNASWTVNLGQLYYITGIRIYNRKGYENRLKFFTVTGDPGKVPIYNDLKHNTYRFDIIELKYDTVISFSSITVSIPEAKNAILSLCEVQIFAASCETIFTPTHGHAEIINGTGKPYGSNTLRNPAGMRISFHCDEGYRIDKSETIECLPSGKYSSNVPTCFKAQCPKIELDKHTKVLTQTDGNNFESVVIFVCHNGYKLPSNSNKSVVCKSNHQWSSHPPQCEAITCLYPVINNGYYKVLNQSMCVKPGFQTKAFYKCVITLHCDPGYHTVSGQSRHCTETGQWSYPEPHCVKSECYYPGEFLHGTYVLSSGHEFGKSKVQEVGSNITIRCNKGYNSTGIGIRTCIDNNVWSGSDPICSEVKCKHPDAVINGSYLKVNEEHLTVLGTVTLNQTIHVVCTKGFYLQYGSALRTCLQNGTWTGESAVCSRISCPPLLSSSVIKYNLTDTSKRLPLNTILAVSCRKGILTNDSAKFTRCNESGRWDATNAVCTVPEPDEQHSNDSAIIGGVSASIVLVLLILFGLAFVLYRRRQREPRKKLERSRRYTDTIDSRVQHEIRGQQNISGDNDGYTQETRAVKQDHTYYNTALKQPVVQSFGSSVFLESDRAYYTFTQEIKMPKTAIRVKDLSDLVLIGDSAKKEFERQFESLPKGMSEPHFEALKLRNRGKNRYKNLYAYDDTRVVLDTDGETQSDYINACYVHGFNKSRKYIASQGPTKEILEDFWKMVWQEDCPKIVMLTKLIEEEKTKCEQYWPNEEGCIYGRITVTVKSTESFSQFLIRNLTVTKDNLNPKTVIQFHFTAWPDKGVPKYASSLVQFLAKVKYAPSAGTGPIVVHCSAGVGRTGTFIALDNLTDQGNELGYVDVAGMVASLRTQRVSLVQTLEQYIFVHHALVEALMLSTSALPAVEFPDAFSELLQMDHTKKKKKICLEFETLSKMSPVADECQYMSSKQVRNRRRNRYSNVLPVDEFMPALTSADGSRDIDYINAVFLPSYKEQKAFIITQAPLESTKEDLWRLVWEHDVHTIVMMNNKLEIKEPEVYWPTEGEETTFGNIVVTNNGSEEINKHHLLSLTIKKHLATRCIKIVQCVGWQPRKSLPNSPEVILSLMEIVQVWQQQTGNHTTVVHCLNGADKSGLYCVISAVIERMKIEQDVAISQVIEEMRNAREQIIPSVEQYQFCHESVLSFMKQYDTYSNFSSC